MPILHARSVLLPDGWANDVTVEIRPDGRIGQIAAGTHGDNHVDLLLPALCNAHSHAFQRAMAGLTEHRGQEGQDSFWTWRTLMYRFLDHLTPDDMQAIAAYAQLEMLEAGFAAVAEFHYVHHQPGGAPYDRLDELSARICAAADDSGIGLTLLPVLYQTGGADGRALEGGQLRFANTTDQFAGLLLEAGESIAALGGDATLGAAAHSLRAVPAAVLQEFDQMTIGPLHLHLAEQEGEVAEIKAAYGLRPVEWAIENLPLGHRWCLVHCTQMTPGETDALARTGAVAGLCPITEASLGDGIFNATGWTAADGALAVGSDSNIRISLTEELRQLEYSQRLRDRARAVLADATWSTGRFLYEAALSGGAQALGRESGAIRTGAWADLVALDAQATDLVGRKCDVALDCWIFAAGGGLIRDVWSAGRHVVTEGRHRARDGIEAGYRKCLARLSEVL